MKRRSHLKNNKIARAKTKVLRNYLGEEITVNGWFSCTKQVYSVNYIGESVLFTDIEIDGQKIDHLWVHTENIKNWADCNFESKQPVTLTGELYSYFSEYNNKPHMEKYSMKGVTVKCTN